MQWNTTCDADASHSCQREKQRTCLSCLAQECVWTDGFQLMLLCTLQGLYNLALCKCLLAYDCMHDAHYRADLPATQVHRQV